MATVSVFDVAKYILEKKGRMTAMKLQKLVYYSQAWSLVWDEKPLFREKIEAWANGPVVRALYEYHRGAFQVTRLRKGDTSKLNQEQQDTIDAVLRDYGEHTAQWLSDLSHIEDPWNDARKGLPDGAPCDNEITLGSMHEYYSCLPADYPLS